MMVIPKSPWLKKRAMLYAGKTVEAGPVSVEDRLYELARCNDRKLKAVIRYPGTQKTVRIAAVRMLKRRKKYADKSGG